MGFGRHLVRYAATGVVVLLGLKVVDSLGYTPMIKSGFNTAASGISGFIKEATGKNVDLNDAVDVDELLILADKLKSQLPEGQGVNVSSSLDELTSLVNNLEVNDIPTEYIPKLQEIINTSTDALSDMNVNLDDISFDSALNLLNDSIFKLREVEQEMNIIVYDNGSYDNYGTYY